MKLHMSRWLILSVVICLSPLPANATSYFVDSLYGDDWNSGSSPLEPWKSLKKASSAGLKPGDSLYLRSGDRWLEDMDLAFKGTAINPITISNYGNAGPARLRGLDIGGEFLIIENLHIDANQQDRDAIRMRGARQILLKNMELENGIRDGIDIQDSSDITLDNLYIHHFLAGSYEKQADAHGVVASNTQRLLIKNTEIHHTSGDSFQSDPARQHDKMSNDIRILDSHFWTGPLEKTFNRGWVATAHLPPEQRQYPGENAIDTKVVKRDWGKLEKMRLHIEGLKAHGWQKDNYINNKAVFNLKEHIQATVKNVEVYDSQIAFRVRGNRGGALVVIDQANIYDCKVGIRAEDGLKKLQVFNSTFGSGIDKHIIPVGKGTRDGQYSWTFINNTFHGKVPNNISENTNRASMQ